jgi:Uma2 family endonuclease
MAETLTRTRWSREDYLRLPQGPPYYELIRGELVEMTRPSRAHYRLLARLTRHWDAYAEAHGGELAPEPNLYLPGIEDVYHPDLVYVAAPNRGICRPDGLWGVPDLICEILSPRTERVDRFTKLADFARAGPPFVCLVSPGSPVAVEEYELSDGDYSRITALQAPAKWTPKALPGLVISAELDALVASSPESEAPGA